MSAQRIGNIEIGSSLAEPADPWGPGGSETLRQVEPFVPIYPDRAEPDPFGQALRASSATAPEPALIVNLTNGWTAVVAHPDSPAYKRGKGGQGEVYCAEVYDQNGSPRGTHALKKSPLRAAAKGRTPNAISADASDATPVIRRSEISLVRETAIMQHIYYKGLERRLRAGVPWTVSHGHSGEWEYMLQTLVPGETLRKHLEAGAKLPTLSIMRDLLETVTDMEDTSPSTNRTASDMTGYGGLVYLDLKPENIMYDPETGDTHLVDGGIAHGRLEKDYRPHIALGTDIWMAPEQCNGKKQILQTNQYQLALIWLELRTGGGYSSMRHEMNPYKVPYTYSVQTNLDMHWEGMNKLMLDYDIPYEEQYIMRRALQADPAQRWESTGAMLDALLAYSGSQTLHVPRTLRVPRLRRIRLVELEMPDAPTLPLQSVARRADLALVR